MLSSSPIRGSPSRRSPLQDISNIPLSPNSPETTPRKRLFHRFADDGKSKSSEAAGGVHTRKMSRVTKRNNYMSRRLLHALGGELATRASLYACEEARHEMRFFQKDVDADISHYEVDSNVYCMSSFNTRPMVALGSQSGNVLTMDCGISSGSAAAHAAGSAGPRPRLFEAVGGTRFHNCPILDMSLSKDDRVLATASGDFTVKLFDVNGSRQIGEVSDGERKVMNCVRLHPLSNVMLLTASRVGTLALFDVRAYSHKRSMFADVYPQAYRDSVDLQTITGSHDVIPPRPKVGKGLRTGLVRKNVTVTAIEWINDTQFVSAGEHDSIIKTWDMRKFANIKPQPVAVSKPSLDQSSNRKHGITSLTFDTENQMIWSLSRNGMVYGYDSNCMSTSPAHSINLGYKGTLDWHTDITVANGPHHSSSSFIAVGGFDKRVCLIPKPPFTSTHKITQEEILSLPVDEGRISCVAWNQYSQSLIAQSDISDQIWGDSGDRSVANRVSKGLLHFWRKENIDTNSDI